MLFQSCRVIFEHLFSLQLLPTDFEDKMIEFDIRRLNRYIMEHKDLVYIFYTKIIDVELPKPIEQSDFCKINEKQEWLRGNLIPQEKGTDAYNLEQDKKCLKYAVQSAVIRFEDLKMVTDIFKESKPVVMGLKSMYQVVQHAHEKADKEGSKFDDL